MSSTPHLSSLLLQRAKLFFKATPSDMVFPDPPQGAPPQATENSSRPGTADSTTADAAAAATTSASQPEDKFMDLRLQFPKVRHRRGDSINSRTSVY